MQLIPHKPYLVDVIQQRKIREYGELEKQNKCGELINYVLALLGVSSVKGDGKELHYLAVEDYISTTLSKYTFGEIKEAFKMLIKGDFKEDIKEVYNKLDCILLGKVIDCYEKEKLRITSGYYDKLNRVVLELEQKQNELSQEEKDEIVRGGVCECFEHYVEHKEISAGRIYVFDVLWEAGLLSHFSTEDRQEKLKKARSVLKAKIQNDKTARDYKSLVKQIQKGYVPGDISLAKEYVLIDYFEQLISEKLHIKDKIS